MTPTRGRISRCSRCSHWPPSQLLMKLADYVTGSRTINAGTTWAEMTAEIWTSRRRAGANDSVETCGNCRPLRTRCERNRTTAGGNPTRSPNDNSARPTRCAATTERCARRPVFGDCTRISLADRRCRADSSCQSLGQWKLLLGSYRLHCHRNCYAPAGGWPISDGGREWRSTTARLRRQRNSAASHDVPFGRQHHSSYGKDNS